MGPNGETALSGLPEGQHDSIRIQFLQGNPVPEYRNRQSRLHILRRAGIFRRINPESPGRHTRKSAEILRGIHPCREEGLSGESRRLYIQHIRQTDGKTASGPKRPLRRGREWRQDTPLHLRRQSRIVRVPLPSGAVTGGNRSEVEGEDVGTGKADELEVFGNRKAYGLQRIIRSAVCQAGSVVVLAEMT